MTHNRLFVLKSIERPFDTYLASTIIILAASSVTVLSLISALDGVMSPDVVTKIAAVPPFVLTNIVTGVVIYISSYHLLMINKAKLKFTKDELEEVRIKSISTHKKETLLGKKYLNKVTIKVDSERIHGEFTSSLPLPQLEHYPPVLVAEVNGDYILSLDKMKRALMEQKLV